MVVLIDLDHVGWVVQYTRVVGKVAGYNIEAAFGNVIFSWQPILPCVILPIRKSTGVGLNS